MANILIIDQSKEQRAELMRLFTDLGHTPVEAWDGSNAAHKSDQFTYDMIVANVDITKMTIGNFIQSLRVGKTNRKTPVFVYAKKFDDEMVTSLSKFGRVQFITLPIDGKALSEKVVSTFKAIEAVNREQVAKTKVYTFSKASLEKCNRTPVEHLERDFFRFFPEMLQQIDGKTVDFGIWLKGSNELLEYVGSKFTSEENVANVDGVITALKRANGGLELYVRVAEKDKLYEHVQKNRLARLASKNLHESHREAAEMFNKLTMCASRFNAADINHNVIATAEQISMDMMQRLSDKPDLVNILVDLLRKDPQMYDFLAMVTVVAVATGKRLGLKDVALKKLSLGCFFHDIGMAILNLPLIVNREMTPDEMMLFRDHPSTGTDHLNALEAKGIVLPEEVYIITMQHHEKFNGTGFPNQKKGRQSKENPNGIHLLAHIVAAADRFATYLLNEATGGSIDQSRIVVAMSRLTGDFDPVILKAMSEVFAAGRQGTVQWVPH